VSFQRVVTITDKDRQVWVMVSPMGDCSQVWTRLHELPTPHLSCLHRLEDQHPDLDPDYCCYPGCLLRPLLRIDDFDFWHEEEVVDEGAPLIEGDPFALERAEDLARSLSFADAHSIELVAEVSCQIVSCPECSQPSLIPLGQVGLAAHLCADCQLTG
jgi:hypothetical protein